METEKKDFVNQRKETRSQQREKEEYAIVLDYLPYGYPLENRGMPIAQVVGKNLTLLEIAPRKGINLEIGKEIYIGDGKREDVQYILGRLPREKLTETAKNQLQEFIKKSVETSPERFIFFFNKAQAMNTRLHQFELLPGFGKKHTKALLEARQEKEFNSFEDIKQRVHNLPDPQKAIERRIFEELTEIQRHNLFIH